MRRQRSKTNPAAGGPRRSRRIDADADPFATSEKPPEPAACPRCGLIVRAGRWVEGSAAHGAAAVECPACRRNAQDFPDGILTVAGSFVAAHDTEMRGLVHHVEENERRNHALARIFGIDSEGKELVVKTTERAPCRVDRARARAPQAHAVHHLFIDRFSVIMALVIGIFSALIINYAVSYMAEYHEHHKEVRDRRRFFNLGGRRRFSLFLRP